MRDQIPDFYNNLRLRTGFNTWVRTFNICAREMLVAKKRLQLTRWKKPEIGSSLGALVGSGRVRLSSPLKYSISDSVRRLRDFVVHTVTMAATPSMAAGPLKPQVVADFIKHVERGYALLHRERRDQQVVTE